jgi:hypothetical protein
MPRNLGLILSPKERRIIFESTRPEIAEPAVNETIKSSAEKIFSANFNVNSRVNTARGTMQ